MSLPICHSTTMSSPNGFFGIPEPRVPPNHNVERDRSKRCRRKLHGEPSSRPAAPGKHHMERPGLNLCDPNTLQKGACPMELRRPKTCPRESNLFSIRRPRGSSASMRKRDLRFLRTICPHDINLRTKLSILPCFPPVKEDPLTIGG